MDMIDISEKTLKMASLFLRSCPRKKMQKGVGDELPDSNGKVLEIDVFDFLDERTEYACELNNAYEKMNFERMNGERFATSLEYEPCNSTWFLSKWFQRKKKKDNLGNITGMISFPPSHLLSYNLYYCLFSFKGSTCACFSSNDCDGNFVEPIFLKILVSPFLLREDSLKMYLECPCDKYIFSTSDGGGMWTDCFNNILYGAQFLVDEKGIFCCPYCSSNLNVLNKKTGYKYEEYE